MNIEGAELPALRGAADVLPLVRHAAIGCHDFLADGPAMTRIGPKRKSEKILTDAGFTVKGTRTPDRGRLPVRFAVDQHEPWTVAPHAGDDASPAVEMRTWLDPYVLMVLDSFNFGGAENLIAELGRYKPAACRCRWPASLRPPGTAMPC